METTSLADAKNRLSALVSAVHGTWERVTITKNGGPVAVLVAVEDLESLTETVEILSDPEAMAAIAEHRVGTGELTTGQEMRLSRAARRALAETLPEGVAAAVWEFVSRPLVDDPHRVGKRPAGRVGGVLLRTSRAVSRHLHDRRACGDHSWPADVA